MKLTTKLLIITLLSLSFFMAEPKNIIETNTNFTVAIEEDTEYERDFDKIIYPHSIDIITTM